jgi:Ni/Co efflux regulator RcnB
VNKAGALSRPPLRRLALLIAAALTLGAAPAALAQPAGHRDGGRHGGGGPHMAGPRMGGPRMSGPRMAGPRMAGLPVGGGRNAWAGPPGRVYASPPMRGGYAPPGRVYASPNAASRWARPRANGAWAGYPVYASPPGYPAPAAPARAWRRGGYLPPSYPGVVVQNFARYHLRRPPDGYNWVREGNELLLVSAGTGLIFDVVPAY